MSSPIGSTLTTAAAALGNDRLCRIGPCSAGIRVLLRTSGEAADDDDQPVLSIMIPIQAAQCWILIHPALYSTPGAHFHGWNDESGFDTRWWLTALFRAVGKERRGREPCLLRNISTPPVRSAPLARLAVSGCTCGRDDSHTTHWVSSSFLVDSHAQSTVNHLSRIPYPHKVPYLCR